MERPTLFLMINNVVYLLYSRYSLRFIKQNVVCCPIFLRRSYRTKNLSL